MDKARGRSISRPSKDLSESPPSNASELSTMLNGFNPHQQRHTLVRTTSHKLPNKNLYTVPENRNEESVLPNGNPHHHASKLIANRQRSSAASVLYNNIMNKRNNSTITLEDYRNANAENKCSSMNVVIRSSRSNSRSRSNGCNNPISHYEVSRNFATRPKSSSAIPTIGNNLEYFGPRHSEEALNVEIIGARNDSGGILNNESSVPIEKPGGTNYKQGGKFFPQNKSQRNNTDIQDSPHSDHPPNSEDGKISLESQIETAINEDIFMKNYTFDNKFDEDAEQTADETPSITSSNQSPFTKLQAPPALSRKDSATLEGFQKDISKISNANSNSSAHVSRLQMKMNALKSKFDSFASNKAASDDSEDYFSMLKGNSSHSSGQSLTFLASKDKQYPNGFQNTIDSSRIPDQYSSTDVSNAKFWIRSDLQAKLLIEKLSNQLRNIERFPSSGKVGEKIVVARLKHVLQDDSKPRKGSSWKWAQPPPHGQNPHEERPVLEIVDKKKSIPFEELFEMAKGNDTNDFKDDEIHYIEDTVLKNKIRKGKNLMGQLWHDSEVYELSGTVLMLSGSVSQFSDLRNGKSDHSPHSDSTAHSTFRLSRPILHQDSLRLADRDSTLPVRHSEKEL